MSDPLSHLNDDQRRAVEHIQRPLLILAGPGTGKTRVTAAKLAYLIQQKGFKSEEVLALTFSEKAAQEMQERIEDHIPISSRVRVHTFHSFCFEVVREYALELGIDARGDVFTDDFQQAFILEHLDEMGIEYFKVPPRPIELARTFQGAIARFKQENIPVERLETYLGKKLTGGGEGIEEETGDEKGAGTGKGIEQETVGGNGAGTGKDVVEETVDGNVAGIGNGVDEETGKGSKEVVLDEDTLKLLDLARVYRAYEEFKRARGLIDFGDMQLLTLSLFRGWPEIARKYRDRLRYIIVDEFQDTDFIQLKLLFQLAPEGNITIVGDDDQSIYRFRGAYLTNIREFTKFYTELGIEPENIVLKTNYRCTRNIQTVAGNLIRHNPEREDKKISTEKDAGEPVHITQYGTDLEQAKDIVGKIKIMHEKEIPWEDFAILVRRRTDARPIVEELNKNGIPFEVLGSRQYFREPIIRAVVSYLKVLHDPIRYQAALGHVLMRPIHGILHGDIPRLSRYARGKMLSLWEALDELDDYEGDPTQFMKFRRLMDNLFDVKGDLGILTLVRTLLMSREFLRTEIARRNREHILLLNRFLEVTKGFMQVYPDADLEDFLTHLEALSDLGLEDETKEPSTGRLHLLTVHGSKGKEFPVVFVPCLNQRRFPSSYQRYKIEIPDELADGLSPAASPEELHEEEERRLLYVAITRARKACYLSYCSRYGTNVRDSQVSVYLQEIQESEGEWEFSKVEECEEEEPEIREETAPDAVFSRFISDIHRHDWQEALHGIAALAQLHGTGIDGLNMPEKQDVQGYLDEIPFMEKEAEEEHLENIVYSPSRLSLYESCPKKYWYGYVMGIPGEWKPYFALGSAVHSVIEIVTKKMMGDEEVSLREALRILEGVWQPSVYESMQLERENWNDAVEMIQTFLIHQAGKGSTILGVEEWIGLDIEGRKLRGKVDRIDMIDGELEVIDYKSSKRKTSRPQLKQDYQMALYWLGVEQAYKRRVKTVGHWYLRMDKEWMVEITQKELEEVRKRALHVMESIEQGKFRATPDYFNCRYCDYGELCDDKMG